MDPYRRRLTVLRIEEPCTEPWSRMEGDDRTRFCRACQRNVYAAASMTSQELSELLVLHEGSPCMQLVVRADGSVVTADGPSCNASSRRARRRAIASRGAASLGLALAAGAFVAAPFVLSPSRYPDDHAPVASHPPPSRPGSAWIHPVDLHRAYQTDLRFVGGAVLGMGIDEEWYEE